MVLIDTLVSGVRDERDVVTTPISLHHSIEVTKVDPECATPTASPGPCAAAITIVTRSRFSEAGQWRRRALERS
jgi:hypothetical protein